MAALYLPLLSVAMDVLPLLHHWSSDKSDRYSTEESCTSNITENVALAIAGKLSAASCDGFNVVSIILKKVYFLFCREIKFCHYLCSCKHYRRVYQLDINFSAVKT